MDNENDNPADSIEERVRTAIAIGRYLRSSSKYHNAGRDFTEACKALRSVMGQNKKFVAQVDSKHYLCTSDLDGNFDIEPIKTL